MIEDNGGGASGFADLTLAPELCHVLSSLGYEEPTPIQLAAIPPLLAGRDLVGQAATGTGKTAAFALPVLQRVLLKASGPSRSPWSSSRRASSQCRSARRCAATGATWVRGAAGLRWRADRPAAGCPQAWR